MLCKRTYRMTASFLTTPVCACIARTKIHSNTKLCDWQLDRQWVTQTRPMCNQYVVKFMRSTCSAHARVLGLDNIIFFGHHEKWVSKEVYGTLKDDLLSNNCLHSVHIADEMNQIINSSPLLIKTYAAIFWDSSNATRKTVSVSNVVATPATSWSNIVSKCNLQMAFMDS